MRLSHIIHLAYGERKKLHLTWFKPESLRFSLHVTITAPKSISDLKIDCKFLMVGRKNNQKSSRFVTQKLSSLANADGSFTTSPGFESHLRLHDGSHDFAHSSMTRLT